MAGPSRKSVEKAKTDFLHTLAKFWSIGNKSPSVDHIAKFAGYPCLNSKHVAQALKELKAEGLVTRQNGILALTRLGVETVPKQAPPTNAEIQGRMIDIIVATPGATNRAKTESAMRLLVDRQWHSRLELLKATGYSSLNTKAFTKLISTMKAHGMIEVTKKGIRLTSMAFPMGTHGDAVACEGVAGTSSSNVATPPAKKNPKVPTNKLTPKAQFVPTKSKALETKFLLKAVESKKQSKKKHDEDTIDLREDDSSESSSHWSVGSDNSSVSSASPAPNGEENRHKKRISSKELKEDPDLKKIKMIPL